MEQYNGLQGTYFSFLPAHSADGLSYECLLGAIEMGYDVAGHLVVAQGALVSAWNFGGLDPTRVWHGNEHVVRVDKEAARRLDPEDRFVMRSTLGILQVKKHFAYRQLNSENE